MILASLADWVGDIDAAQASVVVAVVAAIGSIIAAHNSRATNKAVNGNEKGTPRLFDLVIKHSETLARLEKAGMEVDLWKLQNNERWVEVLDELRSIKLRCPSCSKQVSEMREDIEELKRKVS